MYFQAYRQSVCCCPGQTRSVAQFGEPARLLRDCLQHGHGLVQDPDPAMLSHVSILASRDLGSPDVEIGATPWLDRKPRWGELMGHTLAEKVWNEHVVRSGGSAEPDLLYIDLHLVHEVTSPQAFDGLRQAG